jgi:hypothetical protein
VAAAGALSGNDIHATSGQRRLARLIDDGDGDNSIDSLLS